MCRLPVTVQITPTTTREGNLPHRGHNILGLVQQRVSRALVTQVTQLEGAHLTFVNTGVETLCRRSNCSVPPCTDLPSVFRPPTWAVLTTKKSCHLSGWPFSDWLLVFRCLCRVQNTRADSGRANTPQDRPRNELPSLRRFGLSIPVEPIPSRFLRTGLPTPLAIRDLASLPPCSPTPARLTRIRFAWPPLRNRISTLPAGLSAML